MKSVKLNNMYELYENGTLVKISNGKEISKTLHKNKNYITFNFQIKINNKKHTLKLHKLMMAHFGLSKQDCIDKGFIYEYSDELYESLRKGDEAKNRKLTDYERYNQWCVTFCDKFDLVNNLDRKDELYYHALTKKAKIASFLNPKFKAYAPDINRLNEMINKLLRDTDRAKYYFLEFLPQHPEIESYFGSISYISSCLDNGIEIDLKYQYAVDAYFRQKEETHQWYIENEKRKEEERIAAEQELKENLALAHDDEQFERCDDCIRICSSYVNTIEELVEMGIKNEFIFEQDIDYLLNNKTLQARMKQYNIISNNRGQRVYTTEDNKNYSDYVDRYMNSHTEQYLQQ